MTLAHQINEYFLYHCGQFQEIEETEEKLKDLDFLSYELVYLPPNAFCYDPLMAISIVVGEKRAVLFDLFATLVSPDKAPGVPTYEILGVEKTDWRKQIFSSSHARLTSDDVDPYQIIGSMAHAIDPNISDSLIRDATDQRIARFEAILKNAPASTLAVLESIRSYGIETALITNADLIETNGWSRSPLAPLFDCTVFSWQVGYAKPDKKIYYHCLDQMKLQPSEAAFVGDGGSNELSGARAIGLTTVFAKGLMPDLTQAEVRERESTAHHVIDELGELLHIDP